MAAHSSTFAGKIPWTEEPGRLQSMGSQRVRYAIPQFTDGDTGEEGSETQSVTKSDCLSLGPHARWRTRTTSCLHPRASGGQQQDQLHRPSSFRI